MHFRPADMSSVHAVFADLSKISASEVVEECGSWWAALPRVQELLDLPNSQTEALVDESGTALAIFGHYPGQDVTTRTTWFIFSKGFMRKGMAVTAACQKRVKALQAGYPGIAFHSYTRSDHPGRGRWFALLGFRYAGETKAGAHHYILLESDKSGDLGAAGQYNPTNPRAS